MKWPLVPVPDVPNSLDAVFGDLSLVGHLVFSLVLLGPLANAVFQIVVALDHPWADVIRALTLNLFVVEVDVQVHPATSRLVIFQVEAGPFTAGNTVIGLEIRR